MASSKPTKNEDGQLHRPIEAFCACRTRLQGLFSTPASGMGSKKALASSDGQAPKTSMWPSARARHSDIGLKIFTYLGQVSIFYNAT